jgi:hypothetical protein
LEKKQEIKSYFNNLENKRHQLLMELKEIDNQILNYNPLGNKWSIIQIIHHLYKSEQLSIVYIKRKLRNANNIKKSSFSSFVRGFMLEWALRFPTKLKAPANVSNVPDFGELEDYKTKWSNIRKDLSEIIKNTDIKILNSDIFKHPSVGEMNMIHALKFMHAHFHHHKKQIDKILLINNKFV